MVQMTMTTYDEELCKILEPNVCTTGRRFEVLEIMRENGIPTVVWMTPILPFINDTRENIEGLLDYCIRAKVWGIINFGMGVTLREGDREYFYQKLDEYFPGMKGRYDAHGIECDAGKVFQYLGEYPENKGYEQISLF